MIGKILKQTSFAICLMAIAIVFVGIVSAVSVPESMDSLDNTTIIRTGYQTDITAYPPDNINNVSIGWIDPNGVKWSTPIRITNNSSTTEMESAPASRHNRDHFVMDQDPSIIQTYAGDIWIAWHSNSKDSNDEIYYTIYNFSSWAWLAPVRLTDDPRLDRHPAIGQMQNGDIWIVWDRSISDNNSELYYTFTSDCGATWTPEVNITNSPTAIDQVPSIARTSDGKVWVSWVTDRDGNLEIYAMYGVLPSSIAVDVRTDKDIYMLGEPVNVSITVTNNGHNTTLLFPTSQLADLNITNETCPNIYHWSHDKVFSEEITGISINQSETIELLNDTWNQVDDHGDPVTPGKYYVDGWMVIGLYDSHTEIHGERLEIAIYSGPRSIKKDAICEIEAITPAQNSLRFLINASIWFINKSLGNELWMNDTHLNPNETPVDIVFDAEMTAVSLLECVKRWDPTTEDAVNDVINKLTRADELIVLAVIDDENTIAKEYICKAYECLSKGEPVHAIGYFKLAWLYSAAQSSHDIP
jgi:hypothetical protein